MRAKLAVEVDGEVHQQYGNPERDDCRDAWLSEQGIFTYRIPAAYIFEDPDAVALSVIMLAEERIGKAE